MVSYDVSDYSPRCADRLVDAILMTNVGQPPVIDKLFWENLDFLAAVKEAYDEDAHDHKAYLLFRQACEHSGVKLPDGLGFVYTMNNFQFIIGELAVGRSVPAGENMPQHADDLVAIVNAVKTLREKEQ